jgi:hypothetical protein
VSTLTDRARGLLGDAEASLERDDVKVALSQVIAAANALLERLGQVGSESLAPGDPGHPMRAPLGRSPGSEE